MGNLAFVEGAIEKKLRDLHCGYIGRVISTDGNTATVQPLGLIKEYGTSETKKPPAFYHKRLSLISDV